MNTKIVKTLLKKELLDIFRDTKTIIIMVIVPLVLYPLMFLGSLLITSNLMKESTVKTYNVAIVCDNEAERAEVNKLLEDALDKFEYHFDVDQLDSMDDYEKSIRDEKYNAIVEIVNPDAEYPDLLIYSLTSSSKSSTCKSMLNKVFDDYSDSIVKGRLKDEIPNYDELVEDPFKVDSKDFSSKEETTGMLIGYVMPFMMVISVLMGAFTVAVDVSVGEKERGTLETLITLPVKNIEMMVSKFIAVTVIALFSVAINLLSFGGIGIYLYKSVEMASKFLGGFKLTNFIPSVILMVILLILFSFFVSAVCLCVDFTAKSVKEANNYTTPLMLIMMTGAGMSVIPGVKLTYVYAMIPILNVSLLIKDLFMLKFDATMITVVFSATLIHTVIAVFVMSKVFSSENILFSEGLKTVKIFEKRANMKEKQIPGVGDIVFMFALMFLISSFLGGYITLKYGFIGIFASQLLMLLIPVLYSWYIKVDFRNVYSLNKPKFYELIGAALFMIGSYIINIVCVTILVGMFPSLNQDSESMSGLISTGSFIANLIAVGLLPAIAEEAAFRGFLYGTLKNKKIPILLTMIITAVVFAAYHMNALQFIYVTFLGLIMSYIIYNSKSIFTTALFHLMNNSFSVILTFKTEFIVSKLPFLAKNSFEPKEAITLILIGVAFLVAAFFISDNKIGIFSGLNKKKVKGNS